MPHDPQFDPDSFNGGIETAASFVERLAERMSGNVAAGQAQPMIAALRHVVEEVRGLMIVVDAMPLQMRDTRAAVFDVRAAVPTPV